MDRKTVLFFLIILAPLHLGYAQDFQVNEITTFVSPDNSYTTLVDFIDNAQNSLYINAYTFDNPYIAGHIIDAVNRGVEVEILLEDAPAGGIPENEKFIINELITNGIDVYFSSNEWFRFLHAKYAIADNTSILITSENFGYTGFPLDNTYGNRGWGIIIYGNALSAYYSEVFFNDLRDGRPVSRGYDTPNVNYTIHEGGYTPKFEGKDYQGSFVLQPILGPGNAVEAITNLIASANESVYIQQFYIYKYWGSRKEGSVEKTPNLFLEAAIEAARRGIEVKILMDSTWYNVEKKDPVSNYHTMKYVNEIATNENLNLEAKLIDLEKAGFEKMHGKGVIVDGKTVLVSSVNWNEHSPTKNREVGVVVTGEVAGYYTDVFLRDWGLVEEEEDLRGYIIIGTGISLLVIYIWRKRYAS